MSHSPGCHRRRRRRRRRRSGVALLMAVLMISIVGAALAALTLSFGTQAKRTTLQAQDAQLHQLLLAGQLAAQASIGQTESGDVALPDELRAAGLSVRFEITPGGATDDKQIHVTARLAGGRSMTQTLQFQRSGDQWQVRSAELQG